MATESKGMVWTGRVMSALPVAMLAIGGVMNLLQTEQAVKGAKDFGFPEGVVPVLGAICLAAAVLYAIPRTSVLGAILVTAWLGGAVATHVRAADGMWPAAIVFGVVTWGGLFLRDARIRALIPLRKSS